MGHIHVWLKAADGNSYCAQCAARSEKQDLSMFSFGKDSDILDARISIEDQKDKFKRAEGSRCREPFW